MHHLKFEYLKTAGLKDSMVKNTAALLHAYVKNMQVVALKNDYEDFEASIQLPRDKHLVDKVLDLVEQKKTDQLKHVVVIGIGGSNLGTIALYEGVYGQLDHFNKRAPKLLFLDTVSPTKLNAVADLLEQADNPDQFLIVVISKSGKTAETIANFEALHKRLAKKFDEIDDRIVAITDLGSDLWNRATEQGISHLSIPKMVGGRYSVFSAVGLFPLALVGIDIKKLMAGAKLMLDRCLDEDVVKNPALASAVLTYLHNHDGKNIHNSFIFHPMLESVGKWYRQLMGESIGKEKDLDGRVVHRGITPIVSIGSTDLHSMAQLYFGGPRDKFFNLVHGPLNNGDVKVPCKTHLPNLVDDIGGKSFDHIMQAIVGGVKSALQKNELPYAVVELRDLAEESIAAYLQFRMVEMMYLAKLLNVNAFDQPNVEDYKSATRELLAD